MHCATWQALRHLPLGALIARNNARALCLSVKGRCAKISVGVDDAQLPAIESRSSYLEKDI
jgi:hypothetical protein